MTIPESDEQDVVTRPRAVTAALVLWVINVVLHLGSAAVIMAGHSAVVDALVKGQGDSAPKLTASRISGMLTQSEFTILGIGVVGAVLVWLMMRRNRWARLGFTVLTFVDLVALLFFDLPVLPVMLGTLLGLVGLFLLYLPRSNAYFAGLRRLA